MSAVCQTADPVCKTLYLADGVSQKASGRPRLRDGRPRLADAVSGRQRLARHLPSAIRHQPDGRGPSARGPSGRRPADATTVSGRRQTLSARCHVWKMASGRRGVWQTPSARWLSARRRLPDAVSGRRCLADGIWQTPSGRRCWQTRCLADSVWHGICRLPYSISQTAEGRLADGVWQTRLRCLADGRPCQPDAMSGRRHLGDVVSGRPVSGRRCFTDSICCLADAASAVSGRCGVWQTVLADGIWQTVSAVCQTPSAR